MVAAKQVILQSGFAFATPSEDFGFPFHCPDFPGTFLETDEEGSWWRFDELADLFDEFSPEHMVPGYALDVPLVALQRFLSADVIEAYTAQRHPFTSIFDYASAFDAPSLVMVAIMGGVPHIVDGHHRLAAAKCRQLSAFAAVVVEFSEDGSLFWQVTPGEFNSRFQGVPLDRAA